MKGYVDTSLAILSLLLLIFNVSGNILVIAVVCVNKKLQNANTLLLSNLALADIVFTVQGVVDIMFVLYSDPHYSPILYILRAFLSIVTLAALSIERYFAILKPFVYFKRATKSSLYKVLGAIWVLSGVLSGPGVLFEVTSIGTREHFSGNVTIRITTAWKKKFSVTYSFALLICGFIIPCAIMIFCYSRVIYHLWHDSRENTATKIALFKSRRKLTKLFAVVTAIFIVTWCPNFIRLVLQQFFVDSSHGRNFKLIAIFLAIVGCAANLLLYSFRSTNFRHEVIKLFKCPRCCKRRRRRPQDENMNEMNVRRCQRQSPVVLTSHQFIACISPAS